MEERYRQMDVLRLLSESTDDYLFLWEFETNQLYFPGPIWEKYALMEQGETCCTLEDWCRVVYEKDRPTLLEDFDQILQGKMQEHNTEYRLVNRQGDRVWISCRGRSQLDDQGQPVRMIGRISDTLLERKGDLLTGAFNITKLLEDMRGILASGEPCYLLLIGVDNLRDINLCHGRDYGNRLLRRVVETLEDLMDAGVHIYRSGGACFVVNLPVDNQEAVQAIYLQARRLLKEYCTISAGVVAYHTHHSESPNTIYQYAEETLERAKHMGKGTIAFFSQSDYEEKLSTIELQEEVHHCIQDGFRGFSLCYQPQIDSGSFELFGAEALLRYNSPTRGTVSPNELIPVLEQTGMICQVGLWVLETALQQCKIWRETLPYMHVSVNVSYVQLAQKGIAKRVLDILKQSGLSGDALTIEVTESMQLQDYSRFNKIFYQWKKAGIEISVDDFGTGYSSLSYLKSLEIDEVKIDRCFVNGIQHSAYNYRLLSNMIELAHSSRIRVCCEGVETMEELAALSELEPDLLQGFLFGRPCERDQFEDFFIHQDSDQYRLQPYLKEELCRIRGNQPAPGDMAPNQEAFETILDAMDEIIYVSDQTTYELYYLNPAGRRLTGVHDYLGQKCYKVLHGRTDPCEFCSKNCLKRDSFSVWEQDEQLWNRHFIHKGKLIMWRGKEARMEITIDISEREMVSRHVREKLDYAQSILSCAEVLVKETDMGLATHRMLALVGEFYQADRAYIFEADTVREGLWNNTQEWCRDGVTAEQASLQAIPVGRLWRCLDIFDRDTSIIILNQKDLRESVPEEWENLQRRGIRRLIATPIRREGKTTGFLGVDNPRHCLEDDSFIRMLLLFLTNRFAQNETEERLGEFLNLQYRDVLKRTNLGLWFIRIDPNSQRREMIADETMRKVMGLDYGVSPEACYQHWYSHINDGYYQYVNLAVEDMIHSGRVVQLEYPWEHPTFGEVMVRCTGVRAEDAGGLICLEGYHRIISDDVKRPRFLQSAPTGEVFEFNERKGTVYFHTMRELLAGEARHEDNFPACWLENHMVHPHFAQRFSQLFHNVHETQDVEGQEILLRSKQGGYEWFKLRTHHLGTETQDRDTILVLLDAAKQERVLELENMRLRDFYHASLSESIAYAEIDLESSQINAAGGLWAGYEQKNFAKGQSSLQFMMEQVEKDVRMGSVGPDLLAVKDWKTVLPTETDTRRFRYQRMIHGDWRWVELVVHTFREQFTQNVYALLYLKDIDTQMRRELAQRNAAQRDPLTNVYNRNAFKSEVERYMGEQGHVGVLLLLDVDNFKTINDQFGHMMGDEVLKSITERLQKIFRSGDLIGRLGGDEFMAFLKGDVSRAILDQRMNEFFMDLRHNSKTPITCSVGITVVKAENFSYEESVHQADMALYRSKQLGKNHFCYAQDADEYRSDV